MNVSHYRYLRLHLRKIWLQWGFPSYFSHYKRKGIPIYMLVCMIVLRKWPEKIITGFFKRSSYSPNNCLGLSHLLLLCIPKSRWLKPINNTYKWNDLLNAVKEFSLWIYCNNMYILKVRKTNLFLFCWP